MKTIKYMGREYEVPDWAKFIAMDSDGDIYVFELRPDPDEEDEDGNGWWTRFNHSHTGRSMLVDQNAWIWKHSLVELEEGEQS